MWKMLPHIALNTEDVQGWGNDLFFLELYKNFYGKIDFNPQFLVVIKTSFLSSIVYHIWTR